MYAHIELVEDGKNISYVLSSGIDVEKDNRKFMCSLSFVKEYGCNSEKSIEFWDNEGYIYERLFDVVIPWTTEKKIENAEFFTDFVKIQGMDLEDFPLIEKLLRKGIELGFFEDYLKLKKETDENI